ncbi:MAG: glycosyltransferase family 39 protein, partial [Chloroflexota bacterium]
MQFFYIILLWVVPGLIVFAALVKSNLRRLERFVLGQAIGYTAVLLGALLIAYIPGPFRPVLFGVLLLILCIGSIWTWGIRGIVDFAHERTTWQQIALYAGLLLVPILLRFWNLGYAQFQGDEGAAISRAARIIVGEDPQLFLHKKGPGELLVVTATWAFTGYMTEWFARLPFAWANLVGLLSVFAIGRKLAGRWAGLGAVLLLMLEGYLLGFSRIVQYQSLVFMLVATAVVALLQFRQRHQPLLIYVAAGLLATGALAHYDAVLVFPAVVFLLGDYLWQNRDQALRQTGHFVAAGAMALVILALFYYPFFTNSAAGGTSEYLLSRLGNGETLFNHLPDTLNRTLIYDSVYTLAIVGIGLACWVLWAWSRRWGWLAAIAALLLAGLALTYADLDAWQSGKAIPLGVLLVGSLFLPSVPAEEKGIFLWFAFPAFFYLYLVALPLTHIYSAIPGLFLVAALGLNHLIQGLANSQNSGLSIARYGVIGMVAVGWGLGLIYAWTLFVSHQPEYLREYDELPAVIGHPQFEVPQEGKFGFPYQAGWQAVNYLFSTGELSGSYDTNEETDITNYYMRSGLRLTCATPDIYIVAENVFDVVPLRYDQIEANYSPTRVLTVQGAPKITVYERSEAVSGEPIVQEMTIGGRDAQRIMRPEYVARLSGALTTDTELPEFEPVSAQMGNFAQLKGYEINTTNAVPGGFIDLVLYWQADGSSEINYQTFTHLHDGETMQGQLDGRPQCGN